jgi:hypothetical protein
MKVAPREGAAKTEREADLASRLTASVRAMVQVKKGGPDLRVFVPASC